jgi:hypothetical protein
MEEQPETLTSGYLEKKSKYLKVWNKRWFVLEGGRLNRYSDETQSTLKGSFEVTPHTQVEACAPSDSRNYLFTVSNPRSESDEVLELSAPDMLQLESWMLCLIQAINGEFSEEENFDAGRSSNCTVASMYSSISATGHVAERINNWMSMEWNDDEDDGLGEVGLDVRNAGAIDGYAAHREGYLLKECSSFLGGDKWKKRYFVLDGGLLRWYDDAEIYITLPDNWNSERLINRYSRVSLLPGTFDGEVNCFSIISCSPCGGKPSRGNDSDKEKKLLRISAPDEDIMVAWVGAIEQEIRQLKDNDKPGEWEDEDDGEYVSAVDRISPRVRPSQTTDGFHLGNGRVASDLGGEQVESVVEMVDSTSPPAVDIPPPRASRLMQLVRRPRGDFLESSEAFQKIYHNFFVVPRNLFHVGPEGANVQVGQEGDIVVIVFENHRYVPILGWKNRNLLPSDPSKLSNERGVKFPNRYLTRTNPPVGYRWLTSADPEVNGQKFDKELKETKSRKREGHRQGYKKFSVDHSHIGAGEGGWVYAASFEPTLVFSPREGGRPASLSRVSRGCHWHSEPKSGDVVRRRKLFRIARLYV